MNISSNRISNEKNHHRELLKLEQNIGFLLPDYFRLFLNSFQVGDDNINWEHFLVPNKSYIAPSVSIIHSKIKKNYELGFYGFYNLEELKDDWETYSIDSDEFEKYNLLRIGSIGIGGGLFIGIEGEKKDKIYSVIWDSLIEEPILWADNIFEYIRGVIVVEDKSNMKNLNYPQFYKNQGEEFWRVKGDNTNPKEEIEYTEHCGFDFIKLRPLNENIDLKYLESNYQLKFPFKFRTFLEHFKFEGKTGLNLEKIYDEKTGKTIHFEKAIFAPNKINGELIEIGRMWDEETFLDSLKDFRNSETWQKYQVLIIGTTTKGYQIGVVIEGEKAEEIWLLSNESLNPHGDTAIKLADDIFRFIRGIEPVYQEEYLDKIYKNWNEDFWRIKKP